MSDPHAQNEAEIHVAAALVFGPAGILVAQRPAGSHLAGFWEFPGGKIEPGETAFSAARRELDEELGIDVEPLALWLVTRYSYPEQTVVLHFVHCRHRSGTPRPLGCAAVRWARREELQTLSFPGADRAVLELLSKAPLWEAAGADDRRDECRCGLPFSQS